MYSIKSYNKINFNRLYGYRLKSIYIMNFSWGVNPALHTQLNNN